MPERSEDFEDAIVQALSEPEFADGLRALHHRHLWLDANARHFIAKQVVKALGLEQVGWFVRFPSGIEAIGLTPFTNDSDMGRQQPVYARPRPEETPDA